MSSLKFSSFAYLSLLLTTVTSSPAPLAIQVLNPRGEYQGGWPLGLSGVGSESCPADASVQCSNTDVNPSCCPSGQTCIFSGSEYANYCCPTAADCKVAVLNFPRCANMTWTMFSNGAESFFCCEPGLIGVYPKGGLSGGICEASDVVIPTSLLATIVSQVGAPTPTPTAASSTVNASATGSVAPAETNPTAPAPGSSSSGSGSSKTSSEATSYRNPLANWSKAAKIGLAVGVGVVVAAVLLLCTLIRRRRARKVVGYSYGYTQATEYDMYGNVVPVQATGYEPYRRADRPVENNVTVNVVQGDVQGDLQR